MTRAEWTEALDELLGLAALKQEGQYLVLGSASSSLPLRELYERFPHGLSLSALRSYPGSHELVEPLIKFIEQGDQLLSQPIRLTPAGDEHNRV